MYHKDYSNFVRSTSSVDSVKKFDTISGEEARKQYLEEIENIQDHHYTNNIIATGGKLKRKTGAVQVSNQKLFTSVQNNNVDNLRQILDTCPDKINTVDEYGWSLLMIACQANSVESVKELLNRGADTTVRDKAGNSAQSLIIKNKNVLLASIILNNDTTEQKETVLKPMRHKKRYKEKYVCEVCGGVSFENKAAHLSSTLHNINASKDRKIPTNYKIPESNKGYQIMLKVGWDKETGLGPDGSGKKYPIKAVQKYDKKGLGLEKKKKVHTDLKESTKVLNKKLSESEYQRNRRIEINFRREFY